MKLFINALKININTDKGLFGKQVTFQNGLNIIRAENTSGKSTLLNAIYYALGLEIIVGKHGLGAVKHVLKDYGEYNGEIFNVNESHVLLEIKNNHNQIITIRRHIKSSFDNRLVEVTRQSLISQHSSKVKWESYYVTDPGAAKNEKGFHYFLADFLDLQLPEVPTFHGKDRPLYMECILPLMAIEQVNGWSGLQATIPKQYGIRNVTKRSFEYLLKLDIFDNEKKKEKIELKKRKLKDDWNHCCYKLAEIANGIGAYPEGIPQAITTILEEKPFIMIEHDGDNIELDFYLRGLRESLDEKSHQKIETSDCGEQLIQELHQTENELLLLQSKLSENRRLIKLEERSFIDLKERLSFIESDIKKNNDINKLKKFGASNLSVSKCTCPACSQPINDSLDLSNHNVMSIDDNINFLKSEKNTARNLLKQSEGKLQRLKSQFPVWEAEFKGRQQKLNSLRKDLQLGGNVNRTLIRDEIELTNKIKKIEEYRQFFGDQVDILYSLLKEYNATLNEERNLPQEHFSPADAKKIYCFSNAFSKYMRRFGYHSTNIDDIDISDDTYRPTCKNYEISYDVSASDGIRIIWSYTIALMQVDQNYDTNHWGITILDEPGQQKMKDVSIDELYKTLLSLSNYQSIIGTSSNSKHIHSLVGDACNLIECGDVVFTPMQGEIKGVMG